MLENFGQRIRFLRDKKGITLNAFAKDLGVSSGYLSQLETGKTESIDLKILEKLQNELGILPIDPNGIEGDETSFRFTRCHQQYYRLKGINPEAAEFLLCSFESGIGYFLDKRK